MHVLVQAALREVAHDPHRARVPAATLLAVCDEVQEAARLLWLGDPDRPLKPFEYALRLGLGLGLELGLGLG